MKGPASRPAAFAAVLLLGSAAAAALQPGSSVPEATKAERLPEQRKPPFKTKPHLEQLNPSQVVQAASIPADFWWDSGWQQCEALWKKIIYRFWKEPISSSQYPGAVWAIRYDVRTEYLSTGGWKPEPKLHSVYYSITYQGGQNLNKSTYSPKDKASDSGVLVTGTGYEPWSDYHIIVKRSGGPQGIEKKWPDPANQTNNCDH